MGVLFIMVLFAIICIIASNTSPEEETGKKEVPYSYSLSTEGKILSLLQSNPNTCFTMQDIQIELRIEHYTTVMLAIQMLEKDGKIKKLHLPQGYLYTYND